MKTTQEPSVSLWKVETGVYLHLIQIFTFIDTIVYRLRIHRDWNSVSVNPRFEDGIQDF